MKCSVVIGGIFLSYIAKYHILRGNSVFNWSGPPTEHFVFTLKNACTNAPPYVVDGAQVYTNLYTGYAGWICHGFCWKTPYGVWNCPSNNPGGKISAAWCKGNIGTLSQNCTAHP